MGETSDPVFLEQSGTEREDSYIHFLEEKYIAFAAADSSMEIAGLYLEWWGAAGKDICLHSEGWELMMWWSPLSSDDFRCLA